MFKYDFDVDLSTDTSTGKIIDKLSSGMTILEFGCGSGRMTKYMHDELQCHVYIAEYDKEAFDVALQYAEDGICEDIQQFGWFERFKDIKFDCILFVDVLEHLIQCESVLSKAKELLSSDGHIYISIPNVTHNDIIIKATNDHFDYTATGLLDNTHVHFWGLENIPSFIEKCGLNLDLVEATYALTGSTEQFSGQLNEVPAPILNQLKSRLCGEVYQFILSLSHKVVDDAKPKYDILKPTNSVTIYYDQGSGFSEQNTIMIQADSAFPCSYHVDATLELPVDTVRLRIDPIEQQNCIMNNAKFVQGCKELVPVFANSVELSDGVLLVSDDPYLTVEGVESNIPISMSFDIILIGNQYETMVCQDAISSHRRIAELASDLDQRDSQIVTLTGEIKKLDQYVSELKSDYDSTIENINKEHDKYTLALRSDYDEILAKQHEYQQYTEMVLGSYRTLVDVKDLTILEKEKDISRLNSQIVELNSCAEELRVERDALSQRLEKTLERRVKRFFRRAKNYLKKKLKLNRA